MKDLHNYNLLQHNTFGMNVNCARFLEFGSEKELQEILPTLRENRWFVIGGGSNLLFVGDFNGIIVHSGIRETEIVREDDANVWLRCGSGCVWDDVVAQCVANAWYGAENLSKIPGEVGASAVQNIGAYGVEVKDLIDSVEAFEVETGEKKIFANADCNYGYRQSRFKQEWKGKFVITYVTYRLQKHFQPALQYGNILQTLEKENIENPTAVDVRNVVGSIRDAKLPDPKKIGNAGSFFMNPVVDESVAHALLEQFPQMPHFALANGKVKIPAGWLIEQCGWKGKRQGSVGVYEKQALVLVNYGGATGDDVRRLCETIVEDVYNRFKISIHPEVNIVE